MLRDRELTLEKTISMGHSAEETNKHIKKLAQDEGENHIDMIQQKSKHGQQQNIINQCRYFSGKHQRGARPAFNRFFNKCGKKGDFASCCRSVISNTEKNESLAKVNQINYHSKVENQSDSEPEFFIGAILQSNYSDNKIWNAIIR